MQIYYFSICISPFTDSLTMIQRYGCLLFNSENGVFRFKCYRCGRESRFTPCVIRFLYPFYVIVNIIFEEVFLIFLDHLVSVDKKIAL